jgi:hypothetical protein
MQAELHKMLVLPGASINGIVGSVLDEWRM